MDKMALYKMLGMMHGANLNLGFCNFCTGFEAAAILSALAVRNSFDGSRGRGPNERTGCVVGQVERGQERESEERE